MIPFPELVTSSVCSILNRFCRGRLPQTSGRRPLRGLSGPVEVLRDRWGVPHIYAGDYWDLFFAQGFVQAQDRLWQMDFQRRLAAGRLAEVVGGQALPVDRWLRTLGLYRGALQSVALLDAAARTELEAFAAGVNAAMAQERLPIEFALLGYRPEPWTPADTLAWGKMIAWMLSSNWEMEVLRSQLIALLGPDRAGELEPDVAGAGPCVAPAEQWPLALGREAQDRARAARELLGPSAHQGLGSNNWVLSGRRTATGMPILANDMHLPLNVPCIWYENHLAAGELDVSGVTFPGVPGIVAGHNGRVAWGFTNGFPDVQDLYVERLRTTPSGGVQVEYQGQWLDARVISEEIHVRGGPPVVERVIVTRHGPIINGLLPGMEGLPLALRWTSLEPDALPVALWRMMHARNCLEFHEALRYWAGPVENVVYADTEGNIAYTLPGKVPIRARGSGRVPAPGWTGEHEWAGYIPFDELPHLYNPPQGYVASANNRVVDERYPYDLGSDFCSADRAQRIVELIEARAVIDVPYVQRMQFDQVSPKARRIAAHLQHWLPGDPELDALVALLREWDGSLDAESPAAVVYQIFARRVIERSLGGKLGSLAARYGGEGPAPVVAELSLFGFRAWEWLEQALAQPSSPWFDQGNGETRDDILRLSLGDTLSYLRRELGPHVAGWRWGRLHCLTCTHPLGRAWPLDRLLNRGPFPVGGDPTTLWASGATVSDPKSGTLIGPPFRFIADLSDLGRSMGILAPGQSGRVGSPHYDDQMQAWFSGEYHPMLYRRADVERNTEERLVLQPA